MTRSDITTIGMSGESGENLGRPQLRLFPIFPNVVRKWQSKRGSRRGPRFLPRVPGSGWLLIGRVGRRKRISRKDHENRRRGLPSFHMGNSQQRTHPNRRKTIRSGSQSTYLMIRGKGDSVTGMGSPSDATPRWGKIAGHAGGPSAP